MGEVIQFDGSDPGDCELIEEDAYHRLYSGGAVEFTQLGVRYWGALFRRVGVGVTQVRDISELTATIAKVRQSLGEEILCEAKQRDNYEEWKALGMIIGGGDLDRARELMERAKRRRQIRPVQD